MAFVIPHYCSPMKSPWALQVETRNGTEEQHVEPSQLKEKAGPALSVSHNAPRSDDVFNVPRKNSHGVM
eukprot:5743564-Amphidinium_carterae.1